MRIHPCDNVEVREDGQKYALLPISKGEKVIKYGFPIGQATAHIQEGEQVSPRNLRSLLCGTGEWEFAPGEVSPVATRQGSFMGYLRKNGDVGIRNELWIVPTVGCINDIARTLAEKSGGRALCHPYGCSQLGDDLKNTRQILSGLCRHPNAGGVLVLGLGCENNKMEDMQAALADVDPNRVKFLTVQDCRDEIEAGMCILEELKANMAKDALTPQPLSKLRIAVKCGGSDGYSGITANPLVGRTMEAFAAFGGTVLMSEIPEVFGAEQLLLSRARDREVFHKVAEMIRDFRRYFINHGEGIADNPSPGNIAGGISTLEEKSLGCVQKAGKVPLMGALGFGEAPPSNGGLYLVNGPGNDMVALTDLAASGAHMILFTTGRGTPLSAPVPTVKISTNSSLAQKKPHWIDFDAGVLMRGGSMEEESQKLLALCMDIANGARPRAEELGYCDIAIFKDGVTL